MSFSRHERDGRRVAQSQRNEVDHLAMAKR
jgi:hypothetical protein